MASQVEAGQETRRILPEALVLAGIIALVLVLAFVILFLSPSQTADNFAWEIGPRMSSMMLGATYATGIFFFVTTLVIRDWHQVRLGFLPITAFTTTLGIATIPHWDAFTHDHLAFWLFAGLYFTRPFIVFGVWWKNQRAFADREHRDDNLRFPPIVRVLLVLIGVIGVVAYLLLFFAPSFMIDIWPWTISKLTSRVLAAELAIYTIFALGMLNDPRWSSARVLLRSQLPARCSSSSQRSRPGRTSTPATR